MLRVFASLSLAVGLLMLAFAVRAEFVARGMDASALRASGTVTEKVSQGDNLIAPRIQFATATGQTIVFTGTPTDYPGRETVGETISVFYEPGAPENAWTDIRGYYIGPVIPGAIGLLFAATGVAFLVFKPVPRAVMPDTDGRPTTQLLATHATAGRISTISSILIACFLLAFGLPLLIAAGYWAFSNYRLDALGSHTTAILVDHSEAGPAHGADEPDVPTETTVSPGLRFTTATGQTIEVAYNGTLPDGVKDGDPIAISYDFAAPENIVVRGSVQLYIAPIAIGIFGVLLVGAAALTVFLGRGASGAQRDMLARMEQMQAEMRRRSGPR